VRLKNEKANIIISSAAAAKENLSSSSSSSSLVLLTGHLVRASAYYIIGAPMQWRFETKTKEQLSRAMT